MGVSQNKANKVNVQETKKFYCKKCGEIFESKENHLKANPKHKEENYHPLPDFPDFKLKKCEITKFIGSGLFTKIFDYFWASNSDLFIIMQFGKAMVTKESVNKIDYEKAEWFFQICQAVKYLHNIGIVHKKLNPHNILITEDEKIIVSDIGGLKNFCLLKLKKHSFPTQNICPQKYQKS